MRAEKHNRIRGLILKILAPEYPRPVDAVILRRCLANFGYPMTADDLSAYLAYLQERGYVRLEEKTGFGIILVSLTASGLDLLDSRIEDVGVN